MLNKNRHLPGECLGRTGRLLGFAVLLLPVKVVFLRARAAYRPGKPAFLRWGVLPAPTERWRQRSEASLRDRQPG